VPWASPPTGQAPSPVPWQTPPTLGQPSGFGTGVADNSAALGSALTPVSSIGVPPYGSGIAPGAPPYGGGVAPPMQRRGWQGTGSPFGPRPGGQNWGNWEMPNFTSHFRGLI
jgi:hypothetical protein